MPRKPLPHDLVAQADRLPLEDLKLLVVRLTEKIYDRELREKLDQPSPEEGGDWSIVNVGSLIAVVRLEESFMGFTGIDRCVRAIGFLNNIGVRSA